MLRSIGKAQLRNSCKKISREKRLLQNKEDYQKKFNEGKQWKSKFKG